MADYFFFLGRNPELSLQEIISFLNARGMEGRYEYENNIALFSLEHEINPEDMIKKLGGTIKIGRALIRLDDKKEFLDSIKKRDIYLGEEDKIKYTAKVYPEDESFSAEIHHIINDFFREQRIKAVYRQPSDEPSESLKFDIEFFAIKFGKNYYFGSIDVVYDPKPAEFRDMGKPFRRSELAISPRLAKILVNLSEVNGNELLLDPFCGVGTIIQEALLNDVNVIGADIEHGVIENCKRNILWLRKNFPISASYQMFVSDAMSLNKIIKSVDGIASEPFLIPLITYMPRERAAQNMINKAENTYIKTLNELKKIVRGKIALSLPVMKSRTAKVKLNLQRICRETGLRLCAGPFSEARENQRVEREIIVLEQ